MEILEKKLIIKLSGRFSLSSEAGEEIRLANGKSRALLALVASEPSLGRSRVWLQDQLWGSRGQQHGAQSLRTELYTLKRTLKKAFGRETGILRTDRHTVSLDPQKVTIIDSGSGEFLEGLNLLDADEFDDWLRVERSRRQIVEETFAPPLIKTPDASLDRPVFISLDIPDSPALHLAGSIFSDLLLRTLRENLMVNAHMDSKAAIEPGALVITIKVFQGSGDRFSVAAWLEDFERRGTVWSAVRPDISAVESLKENLVLSALVAELSEAVGDALSGHFVNVPYDRDANLLANLAVRKLFTISKSEIEIADRLLAQATEIEPRGIFHAWRAQLLTIQFVEQYDHDVETLREKSRDLCQRALADDPKNSNVLAAVANARMILEQDYLAGNELAEISIRSNPSNPLAWWSLSNARLHDADYDGGYRAALQAQKLAENTRLKFWGDFQRSLAAAIIGNFDEALQFGASSNALAPNFRPALRYLMVLNAKTGHVERARRNMADLSEREADFSVDRMLNDGDYPARFIRKSGLLKDDSLRDLE